MTHFSQLCFGRPLQRPLAFNVSDGFEDSRGRREELGQCRHTVTCPRPQGMPPKNVPLKKLRSPECHTARPRPGELEWLHCGHQVRDARLLEVSCGFLLPLSHLFVCSLNTRQRVFTKHLMMR